MSLVIRLTRIGKKGESKYRVAVSEKRSRKEGKAVELIGWVEKRINGINKNINKDRYSYWISRGAKPSATVSKLIK